MQDGGWKRWASQETSKGGGGDEDQGKVGRGQWVAQRVGGISGDCRLLQEASFSKEARGSQLKKARDNEDTIRVGLHYSLPPTPSSNVRFQSFKPPSS